MSLLLARLVLEPHWGESQGSNTQTSMRSICRISDRCHIYRPNPAAVNSTRPHSLVPTATSRHIYYSKQRDQLYMIMPLPSTFGCMARCVVCLRLSSTSLVFWMKRVFLGLKLPSDPSSNADLGSSR